MLMDILLVRTPRRAARWAGRLGLVLAAGLMVSAPAAGAAPIPPTPGRPEAVINHACPDAYEVDDTSTAAQVITAGATQQHNFDGNLNTGVGDKDWVKFQVHPSATYTFTTSGLSALTDTVLVLYGPDGVTKLAENDDVGGGYESQIVWQAPFAASGWYYVVAYNNPVSASAYENCTGVEVRYSLTMTAAGPHLLFLPLVQKS